MRVAAMTLSGALLVFAVENARHFIDQYPPGEWLRQKRRGTDGLCLTTTVGIVMGCYHDRR